MKHSTAPHGETSVSTPEAASVLAYDVLRESGCEDVVVDTPYQTSSTWIVPAVADGEPWRVHVDPESGATRTVRARG